jgi:probable H4MPT-linked C1 transfer pathway protein
VVILGVDIGGANLKAADGRGFAASRYFPLWREPAGLADALHDLLRDAPQRTAIAATMTGELADCFTTKAEGVRTIVQALICAASDRPVYLYLTDGRLVLPEVALESPLAAAAANWHALARFAGRHAPTGRGLVVDIGSTTTDVIPLVDGSPVAIGQVDPERLLASELVYTGVERSPVCALVRTLPWQGRRCPVAQEVFATTWDAWLTLDELPQEAQATYTADGRPATHGCARDRLARSICADRTMFDQNDAAAAAAEIATAQTELVAAAIRQLATHAGGPPSVVVLAGRGEFLARRALEMMPWSARTVSLAAELGPEVSRVATAHALAVLASEILGES